MKSYDVKDMPTWDTRGCQAYQIRLQITIMTIFLQALSLKVSVGAHAWLDCNKPPILADNVMISPLCLCRVCANPAKLDEG